ncbi:hypothetical protein UlMin_010192 [Ulmus minor]
MARTKEQELQKKKKKKKQGEKRNLKGDSIEEEEVLRDPLEVLGFNIMSKIFCSLDAHSLALSLLVSLGWNAVASSDRLWTSKCEELWLHKAHIPRSSQARGLSKLAAYSLSVMDGKRTRITKYDLSDHVWEFHFNKAAPEYWRNLDPYWKGCRPLMHRYFHLDGSQTADPDDTTWGGHESCFCIVTSFLGEKLMRDHYVRINRWPKLMVCRNQDWSWRLSNHLNCYTSIPDADKQGGTGPLFSVI